MISGILTNPKPGDVLKAGETFTVSVQTQNLVAGAFTNAQLTYYSAPQDLSGGKVVGHTHVTIQDIGNSLTPTTPPNPAVFAFFKGINDAGNGKGLLSATVTGGLPAGFYRVCTMTSSSNHQPVLMPVAQRGAQDDCTKFQVTAAGGNNNANANAAGGNNAGKSNTAAAAAAATSAVKGNGNAAASSVAAAKTSAVKGNGGKAASTSVAAAAAKTSAVKSNGSKAASTSVAAAAATKAATAASGASAGASSVTVKSGSLGGSAPLVTASGNADRPFEVNGNTFVAAANAVERSCDIQFNTCADLANSGKLNGKTVSDCTTQKASCTQG
jgi:transcription initiation factor TFIID subunit 15